MKGWKFIGCLASRMRSACEGMAMVEFAVIIPVLLALICAAGAITQSMLVHQRVDRAGSVLYTIAAALPANVGDGNPDAITLDKLNSDVFAQLPRILHDTNPANMVAIATGLRKEGNQYVVKWQEAGGGTLSDGITSVLDGLSIAALSNGGAKGASATVPGGNPLIDAAADGQTVLVIETFYHYRPAFIGVIPAAFIPDGMGEKNIALNIVGKPLTSTPSICLPPNYIYAECTATAPPTAPPSVPPVGGGPEGSDCTDQCGETHRNGNSWCAFGPGWAIRPAYKCVNGNPVVQPAIAGLGCDASGPLYCP